jgi:hypothetical protein
MVLHDVGEYRSIKVVCGKNLIVHIILNQKTKHTTTVSMVKIV